MILQRIGNSLRERDWFTVVLEIVIVVVGIFIGLQVDDWNEARKNASQERFYLALIETDITNMLAELSQYNADARGRFDTMSAAVNALAACDTGDEAKAAVKFALENYQIAPPPTYLGATYDEMVSTGALARIDDINLKQSIAYTFSQLARLNQRYADIRVSLPVVDEIVWRNVTYEVAASGRQSIGEAGLDMAEFVSDPRFKMPLWRWSIFKGIRWR